MKSHRFVPRSATKSLPGALVVSGLAFAPAVGQALEVEVSGQVNRALMHGDNDVDSEVLHVDNDISGTRFRFGATEEMMAGTKAGVVFEAEFQSNPSNEVDLVTRTVDPELGERHMYVFFQSAFGTVSLGQGDGAANGGTEVDLSGTAVAQNALGTTAIGGGIEFASAGVVSDTTIGNVISNQDFESRYDRLLYETPAFGPVTLALSTGTNDSRDVSEVALSYSGDMAGGKLAAVVGFSSQDAVAGGIDDETVGGSVSWLAPGGLSVTFATSTRDIAAGQEGEFMYFKVGYTTGKHAVAADFATGDDQAAVGTEAEMVGVAYVYQPVDWAELYAAAKETSLDAPGASFDDIQIIMVGSRLKF